MCNQGCRTEDCAHQRESDTWLSRDLTPRFLPPLAPATTDPAPVDTSAHESASEAVLRRDGGR